MLRIVSDLLDFAEHLRASASGSTLDFSAARVVSRWFRKVLSKHLELSVSDVYKHAQALANEVCLTSGHAMQEIWGAFVRSRGGQKASVADLVRLDELALRLDPNQSSYRKSVHSVFQ
jgi:hypothetical protein